MKDIILFGIPGAGKGTQAELLIEKMGEAYSHVSTGNIFRALLSKDNAIGRYVTKQMGAGQLVDDQVTISIFNAYFFTVLDEQRAMLLDGYPRSIPQLTAFLALAKEHKRELLGIYFDLSDENAIERMMGRARAGEDEKIMQIRLDEYYAKTHPIVEEFKKHAPLITVDAAPSIEDVHTKVMSAVVSGT